MKRIYLKKIAIIPAIIMAFTCFGTIDMSYAETASAQEEVSSQDLLVTEEVPEVNNEEIPGEETPQQDLFTEITPEAEASVYGETVTLVWANIPEATAYEVYRSTSVNGEPNLIGTMDATEEDSVYFSYTDKKINSGCAAYYYVRGYNGTDFTQFSSGCRAVIYRVYVETGHGKDSKGKWDSGCCWKKYQEAKLMIPICKSMTNYLRKSGVYVDTDAFSNNNINLYKVIAYLQKHKGYYSAFVNVHCDYRKAPKGTLPLYKTASQKKLANALNKGVHSTVKIKNRGLKKRKNLMTLNKNIGCNACIYETGNIKKDNKVLRTKYNAYGKGLAKGLCNYLGVRFQY